ncbi:hypothetical protein CLV47_10360 [Antricoccus suffuscus]|uniref:Uncharacterized protein n=1 Tax=Antricoccus suffuscus TaxID=1629062 RepID=A0A2T1A385_9ACTN|nr:hypothetical protein [Antricoccus suffuscus]PRZ43004.1 hypothetical protein CLV47_10360 [Antricoccus suffuscus]
MSVAQIPAHAAPPSSPPAPPAVTVDPLAPGGGAQATPPPATESGDFSNPPADSVVPPEPPAAPPAKTGYDEASSKLTSQSASQDIYTNTDGTTTVKQYTEAVNAVDAKTGKWVDADPTLTKATSSDLSPAADDVSGVKDQSAALKAKQHSLHPVFGVDASGGTLSASTNGVSVKVTPVKAPSSSKVKKDSATQVTYPAAASGSDLTYDVSTGTVKESIVLDAAPGESGAAAWSFWLDIDGGSDPAITDLGAVEVLDTDGEVAFGIPVPYVFDSSAQEGVHEAEDTNGHYVLEQVGKRWKLTVQVDRAWLNDPALVYPVMVDPTLGGVGYDAALSIASDGTIVQGGPMKVGNPNDGRKVWRGFAHYDYLSWAQWGYQVVHVSAYLHRVGGTPNGYAMSMWHAGSFTFGGNVEYMGLVRTSRPSSTSTAAGWCRIYAGSSGRGTRTRGTCSRGTRAPGCIRISRSRPRCTSR